MPTESTAKRPVLLDLPYAPVEKRPLPPGRPREWYVTHNRRLKAMRLAIALLDSGVYVPNQARNETIREHGRDDRRPPAVGHDVPHGAGADAVLRAEPLGAGCPGCQGARRRRPA